MGEKNARPSSLLCIALIYKHEENISIGQFFLFVCSNTYADSLAWQLNISHVTLFHMETNLWQEAEETFISDSMTNAYTLIWHLSFI